MNFKDKAPFSIEKVLLLRCPWTWLSDNFLTFLDSLTKLLIQNWSIFKKVWHGSSTRGISHSNTMTQYDSISLTFPEDKRLLWFATLRSFLIWNFFDIILTLLPYLSLFLFSFFTFLRRYLAPDYDLGIFIRWWRSFYANVAVFSLFKFNWDWWGQV